MPTLHGYPKRPHPAVRYRLDVFHAEPLRSDHPLGGMDNVTLTAHAGFRTLEASMALLRRAIDIVSGIVLAGTGSG
jgi:D-3-phosphoglycerate dehydrogenase